MPLVFSYLARFFVIMGLEFDLRYLFEEKGVLVEDVEKLVTMGITSMSRLSLLDDSRTGARNSITKILGLDPDTADGRGRLIAILDAWETSQKRVEVQRGQEAEAKMARLPKTLTKSAHLSLRRSAETVMGEISDKIAPSRWSSSRWRNTPSRQSRSRRSSAWRTSKT